MFLMIGTTLNNEVTVIKNGKYQGFSGGSSDALYMINTETGELYKKRQLKKIWKRVSPETDRIKE